MKAVPTPNQYRKPQGPHRWFCRECGKVCKSSRGLRTHRTKSHSRPVSTSSNGSLKMVDDRRKPNKQGDDYPTPDHVYNALNEEFDFNDDPCPLGGSGGLSRDWGSRTYLNPPYSNPSPWCQKAVEEMKAGKLVVGLLRGDVSAGWFHDYILPFAEIRFVRGRISFEGTRNMHGSIIVIWDGRK